MTPRKRRPDGGGLPREVWGAVYPHLDLHGETGERARHRTETWLRERWREGVRVVVVVTGRGLHSRGLPVLRGEVEELLHALKGTVVASWSPADGGGGFRVELRRPPSAPPRPAARPAHPGLGDPALRAAAEEALWELGVAPTRALLEAEIRRILRERGEGE